MFKSIWERTIVVKGSSSGEAAQPIRMGAGNILIRAHRIGFYHTTSQAGVQESLPCFDFEVGSPVDRDSLEFLKLCLEISGIAVTLFHSCLESLLFCSEHLWTGNSGF